MIRRYELEGMEKLITRDEKFVFTAFSLLMILIIYINQLLTNSPIIGAIASLIFFSLNTIFLEQAFFKEEISFIRLTLGSLTFLLFLGIIGWITLIAHNLDVNSTSAALCIVTVLCSTINKLNK
jgi:hypothetical protein